MTCTDHPAGCPICPKCRGGWVGRLDSKTAEPCECAQVVPCERCGEPIARDHGSNLWKHATRLIFCG